jgi:hypothetical protein
LYGGVYRSAPAAPRLSALASPKAPLIGSNPAGLLLSPSGVFAPLLRPACRRWLRPALYVGCRPVVPPSSSLPSVAQVGRKLPRFAPSFVRPSGALRGHHGSLPLSELLRNRRGRCRRRGSLRSLRSLALGASHLARPSVGVALDSFGILALIRSNSPSAVGFPQPPPSPRGRGATFRESCRVAVSTDKNLYFFCLINALCPAPRAHTKLVFCIIAKQ